MGSSEKNKTVATLAETSRKVGKEGEPSAQPHTLKNNPQGLEYIEGDGLVQPSHHMPPGNITKRKKKDC